MNSVWDLSQAEGISDLSIEEIRAVVLLVGSKWHTNLRVRSALVVSRALNYGMARMYEIQLGASTTNDIRVFKNVEEAEEWVRTGSL